MQPFLLHGVCLLPGNRDQQASKFLKCGCGNRHGLAGRLLAFDFMLKRKHILLPNADQLNKEHTNAFSVEKTCCCAHNSAFLSFCSWSVRCATKKRHVQSATQSWHHRLLQNSTGRRRTSCMVPWRCFPSPPDAETLTNTSK